MSTAFTQTQRINARAQREAAERQARYLGWILIIEIFGFGAVILIELVK